MKMRAGMTGALALLTWMIAVPAGGMQQSGGSQDPLGPTVPPASQSGMPSNTSGRNARPQMQPAQDDANAATGGSEERMAIQQNTARQKQIVADANKLLDLALQLKDDVNKSSKDTLSLDVVKKADEIERLAHSVKEKMRN